MLRADICRVIHKTHICANGSLQIALTLDPSPTRLSYGQQGEGKPERSAGRVRAKGPAKCVQVV